MSGEIRMQVRGASELAALARRIRETGDRDLRLELLRGIRRAVRPVPAAVRASARESLPRGGGLAELVAASRIGVRNRLSGAAVGVRVVGSNKHDIQAMDMGIVRHPRYGDRRYWYQQRVRPGWWSSPTSATAPAARAEVVAVLETIKRKIEG